MTLDEAYPEELISIRYYSKAGGVFWALRVGEEVVSSGWALDLTVARKQAHTNGISAAVDWFGTQR